MSNEFFTIAGFIIAIVGISIKVGRYVERVENFFTEKRTKIKTMKKTTAVSFSQT